MILSLYKGYPDYIGRRQAWAGSGVGPASYSQTTGDVLQLTGFQQYVDSVNGSMSVSGTYFVRAKPSNAGPRQAWSLHWYTASSGAEVSNAVNLSGETVVLSGFGGSY